MFLDLLGIEILGSTARYENLSSLPGCVREALRHVVRPHGHRERDGRDVEHRGVHGHVSGQRRKRPLDHVHVVGEPLDSPLVRIGKRNHVHVRRRVQDQLVDHARLHRLAPDGYWLRRAVVLRIQGFVLVLDVDCRLLHPHGLRGGPAHEAVAFHG